MEKKEDILKKKIERLKTFGKTEFSFIVAYINKEARWCAFTTKVPIPIILIFQLSVYQMTKREEKTLLFKEPLNELKNKP